MKGKFKEIESQFQKLKQEYRDRKISDQDYKERLKHLRLTDKSGRCWTIGAKTGHWYYFDGSSWIEQTPYTSENGKTVCAYCGFENNAKNKVCDYCGGNLEDNRANCSKCGIELAFATQECPKCSTEAFEVEMIEKQKDDDTQDVTEDLSDTSAEIEPPRKGKEFTWEGFERFGEEPDAESESYLEDGASNMAIRALSPFSFFLFFGILGVILGVIFGVFLGISSYFSGIVAALPAFLQTQYGTLFGGVVYGILGGIFGFGALGGLGFLSALLINLILSFFGGLKVRIDKIV